MKKLSIAVFVALVGAAVIVPGGHALAGEVSERADGGRRWDGPLEDFLGAPSFQIQKKVIEKGDASPLMLVTTKGAVLAMFGDGSLRRSEDGGETWGELIRPEPSSGVKGWLVNDFTGEILYFREVVKDKDKKNHDRVVRDEQGRGTLPYHISRDDGKTWTYVDTSPLSPDCNGNIPFMRKSEHGITLRYGKHAGRLLRPARDQTVGKGQQEYHTNYNTALYSDDNGKSWQTTAPFPFLGTGEGAVVELSDGTVYYNSRRHWAKRKEGDPDQGGHLARDAYKRWIAWSHDGGETWVDGAKCEILPDGVQDDGDPKTDSSPYGNMAGLVRLPISGRNIVLYSNCDNAGHRLHDRKKGTVWVSFDGAKTWPVKRLVDAGTFWYSSMDAGRPRTQSEGMIYLGYDAGESLSVARFNLSWLVDTDDGAVLTGDGDIPAWLTDALR